MDFGLELLIYSFMDLKLDDMRLNCIFKYWIELRGCRMRISLFQLWAIINNNYLLMGGGGGMNDHGVFHLSIRLSNGLNGGISVILTVSYKQFLANTG